MLLSGCINNSFFPNDPQPRHTYYREKYKNKKYVHSRNMNNQTKNESTSLQGEVFRLINIERSKVGLPRLMTMPALKVIAQVRAEEITQHFSHDRPNGESWESILSEYGLRWRACGVNIAMGQESPSAVMNSWMHSSGHRANILGSQYTHVAIGVVRNHQGRLCWTQNFFTPR